MNIIKKFEEEENKRFFDYEYGVMEDIVSEIADVYNDIVYNETSNELDY